MTTATNAKERIDTLFERSSVYSFQLIRIAETLHRHRTSSNLDLSEKGDFEISSRKWGNNISIDFFGHLPTSKQINTHNVFKANAMPSELLAELGETNKKGKGFVEAYIYKALEVRLSSVRKVESYITSSTADAFSIRELAVFFQTTPGLRRSIGKMYEILVYALFATIIRALKAQITLEIGNKDKGILKDFEHFIKMVLGIDSKQTGLVLSPIQVKHLTLTAEIVEDIADDITADKIVIVCLDAEKETIESLLNQVGLGERIQGIITIDGLDDCYKLCLSKKYRDSLGANLLKDVRREFNLEFPSGEKIKPFMESRQYDKISLPSDWRLPN